MISSIKSVACKSLNIIPSLKNDNKVLQLSISQIRVSGLITFITFGLYGWGTTGSSFSLLAFMSDPLNIILVIVFISLIFLSRQNNYDQLSFRINWVTIRNITAILFLLILINFSRINKSLSWDELSYAFQAQSHGLQLLKYLAGIHNFSNLSAQLVLKIVSILLILVLLGVLLLWSRNASDVVFLGGLATVTFLLRLIFDYLGLATYSNNSPFPAVPYFLSTSIFPTRDITFRLTSLLFVAIFLGLLKRELGFFSSKNLLVNVLILAFITTMPIFYFMSTNVEIAVWSFYFAVYFLVKIAKDDGKFSPTLLVIVSLATYLRFSLIFLLLPLLLAMLFIKGNSERIQDRIKKVLLPVLILTPNFCAMLLSQRGIDSMEGQYSISSAKIFAQVQEVLANMQISTSQVGWQFYWILFFLAFYFSARISIRLFVIIVSYVLIYFVIFVSNPFLVGADAPKYVAEWFYPVVALGFILTIQFIFRSKKTSKVKYFVALSMLILNVYNLLEIQKYVQEPSNSFLVTGASQERKLGVRIPVLPFPYGDALDYLKENNLEAECFNSGVTYSVLPQVLSGVDMQDFLALDEMRKRVLDIQELSGENWMTISTKTLDSAQIDCVVVGEDIATSTVQSENLSVNGWKVKHVSMDRRYLTRVTIFTKSNL